MAENEKIFDVAKSIAAQKEIIRKGVESKQLPEWLKSGFAPANGICYRCKRNIYSEVNHGNYSTGISVERATNELITGCPHCNASYCD